MPHMEIPPDLVIKSSSLGGLLKEIGFFHEVQSRIYNRVFVSIDINWSSAEKIWCANTHYTH